MTQQKWEMEAMLGHPFLSLLDKQHESANTNP